VNAADLLRAYDRFERREAQPVGQRAEAVPPVVRHVGPPGATSWIVFSELGGADADAVIAREVAYFARLGQPFEWKHYDHDRPVDLQARLAAAGFELEEPEALMAFDLGDHPPWADADTSHDVRAFGPDGWEEVAAVLRLVWPELAHDFVPRFGAEARAQPDRVRLFAAYDGDRAVAAGWTLRSSPHTPFLGLYGGATLTSHRGRGLYRALVAARARHAQAIGARYLTVDAGPMSEPILRRLGFVRLTTTTPCTWRPPGHHPL
jgi:GNAT superfamily N-acetyltransferase